MKCLLRILGEVSAVVLGFVATVALIVGIIEFIHPIVGGVVFVLIVIGFITLARWSEECCENQNENT